MMISLRGLSAYQVEAFARAVEGEMAARGYATRMADAEGPEVKVCMAMPPEPELCTTLQEAGAPWVIYSPSNIANLQADRYEFMYGGGDEEQVVEQTVSHQISTPARSSVAPTGEAARVQQTLASQAVEPKLPGWASSLTANPWLLIGGGAALLFLMGRGR